MLIIFDIDDINFFNVNLALTCLNEEVENEPSKNCLIFTNQHKKENFKTFLTNSYPLES